MQTFLFVPPKPLPPGEVAAKPTERDDEDKDLRISWSVQTILVCADHFICAKVYVSFSPSVSPPMYDCTLYLYSGDPPSPTGEGLCLFGVHRKKCFHFWVAKLSHSRIPSPVGEGVEAVYILYQIQYSAAETDEVVFEAKR